MTDTASGVAPAAPSRVNRVVASTALLGIVAAVGACLGWSHRTVPPVKAGMSEHWLPLLLLLITFVAEFTAVRLRRGDDVEALTLLEAAMVADVLLLPPAMATIIAITGLALASLVDPRRAMVKKIFNLGAHATGTALLVTMVSAIARPGEGLTGTMVVALLAGTLTFAALNLLLLSWVLSAASGAPIKETMSDGWRLSLVMAVGTCGIGAVAVGVGVSAPALLPFTLLPAAALTYAYRAAAQEADERERTEKLVALTQVLAGRLVADDLLLSFLERLREAFAGVSTRVVLEGDDESGGGVVLADEAGVVVTELTAFDAALLALAGATPELVKNGLPTGWGRTLIAPLEAEGRRLGVLVLVGQGNRLRGRDLAVLSPLVSALAVALRGAEHLTRLIEETGKLQAVVDHSSDGILVVDGNSRVQVWSPSMYVMSGLPPALATDRILGELLPCRPVASPDETSAAGSQEPEEELDLMDVASLGLSPEDPRRTVELALRRPDGEERWVRMSHNAVFEGGHLTQDVVLVYDVTRERQVERLKSDFIATVSHELRTPITPIKGYVELLRRRGEDMTPERRREMLDTVADRVSHLARLVEDLLLASGVSAPSAAVVMQTADLASLTRRTVDDFPGDASRLTTVAPTALVLVQADPTRVIQVLSNLISNGLKYSPDGSPVDVECRVNHDERTASVRVSDHGRGIPADQLDRVFDKFHRVEDPLRMTTSGTGLGLFIARRLAGAMGGTLSVESTLGKGATFCFQLPLAPEGAALPTVTTRPDVPFGLPGPRSRARQRPPHPAPPGTVPPVPPSDTQGELSHST
ncbi:MAG TPA: PAS domain-containing sensor histidine kinase [Frankiaceae bacterium]|jgi:signal transduction histidine kinase|nr:PAS domain-containing sensor histidine kinase [Frankiaceae bacterium]